MNAALSRLIHLYVNLICFFRTVQFKFWLGHSGVAFLLPHSTLMSTIRILTHFTCRQTSVND